MTFSLLIALALAAQATAPPAPAPSVIQAYDAWEQCALDAAFAAAPGIADDVEAARHGLAACGEEGRAFARLYLAQNFVRVDPRLETDEQRTAAVIARISPSLERNIVRNLPAARRAGATRAEMVHSH